MSSTYKTPDGSVTTSTRRYLKEWRALSKPLERHLDVRTIGFDPGLLVQANDGGAAVDIPTWLAKRIVAALQQNGNEAP